MSNLRTIMYAILPEFGTVVSRVGSELAWPILEFDKIGKDAAGNFTGDFTGPLTFKLEKIAVHSVTGDEWRTLIWTRKIPNRLKNEHREFWGMKPLKGQNRWEIAAAKKAREAARAARKAGVS